MNTLLQLNTSLNSSDAQSSRLASEYSQAWQAQQGDARVIVRDLAADPVPHLTAERFNAFLTPAEKRTPEQAAIAAQSDALIAELQAAETLVIALPMYNFGIPSTLKSYFDHVARAGITFRYTATGPQGLLTGKKVIVVATRGGKYAGTPLDTQSQYLRDFLAFLGMTDVEFIYAEGLALGDESREAALASARQSLLARAAQAANAASIAAAA